MGLNYAQIELYNFLVNNSDRTFKQREIAEALPGIYPVETFGRYHDTTSRRRLSADIQAINDSDEVEKIIISDGAGVRIASREEFEKAIRKQYAAVFRKLRRIHKKASKGGLDGQTDLFLGESVEAFPDEVNKFRAARLASGLKMSDVVEEFKKYGETYSFVDMSYLSKMETNKFYPTEAVISVLSKIYANSEDSPTDKKSIVRNGKPSDLSVASDEAG